MTDKKTTANPVSRRTLIVLSLICLASFAAHLFFYPQLPDMVPTHWDTGGNVNGWSSREAALGLGLMPLGMLFLFYLVPKMDPRGHVYERMGGFYTGFITLFTLFMVGMTWTTELTVFGIIPENGSPIGPVVSVVVGLGLVMLGNYLPKVKRNYTFGIKTPWALDDDANWRLTHRFGGAVMLVTGLAVIVGGGLSLVLEDISLAVILIGVLGGTALTGVYSYLVFRNGNKPLRPR